MVRFATAAYKPLIGTGLLCYICSGTDSGWDSLRWNGLGIGCVRVRYFRFNCDAMLNRAYGLELVRGCSIGPLVWSL